ncbi:AraC family transcriptional regulator [Acinetobacter baumannii]|nr:AraC family transcriptional regulator [Acinetobacter baumannii]
MDMSSCTKAGEQLARFYCEQPFFKKRIHSYQRCDAFSHIISEFYRLDISNIEYPVLAVPDGCIDILFECSPQQPQARICGSTLNSQVVPLKENTPYFGIRFLPGIIPNFIEVSSEEILNQCLNFNELVSNKNWLIEKISSEGSIDQQINLFLNTFSERLSRKFSTTTQEVLHFIITQNNEIKIKDLERLTGYCSRHIQRMFKHDVGMSIKTFACIIRFQSAVQAMNTSKSLKLSDLTYDLGYNDQAHFHKEFKKFSQMSPSDFIKYFKN